MKKSSFYVALLASCLLASCAKTYQVSTNLDPENFTNAFAPAHVKQYQSVEALPEPKQLLGIVSGISCQEKPHLAAPSDVEARTDARRQAFDLGANAIVFTACVAIENKMCVQATMCTGEAFLLANKK